MNKLLSCEFNIDTGNVELRYADGSMISIDCTEVEKEVAMSINARSELDWLVYNAPFGLCKVGSLRRSGGLSQTSVGSTQRDQGQFVISQQTGGVPD